MKRKASESLCPSCCQKGKCDCIERAADIWVAANVSLPEELQPHQVALVEIDGCLQDMIGSGDFLFPDRRPRRDRDTSWEFMEPSIAAEHERGLQMACASSNGRSWYRVGDLIVSIKRFHVYEDDNAPFGWGAFTVSTFDPGSTPISMGLSV